MRSDLTLADGRVLSPSSRGKGAKTIESREPELVRIDFRRSHSLKTTLLSIEDWQLSLNESTLL